VVLVKIDIEGSEYEILHATPLPVWANIPAIAMELHDGIQPGDRENFLEGLKARGFHVSSDAFSTLFCDRGSSLVSPH